MESGLGRNGPAVNEAVPNRVAHRSDRSDLLKVGEFFHQLLHSVLRKEHGELGFVALAFAHHHGAFAVFAVADALALLQAGCARELRGCPSWGVLSERRNRAFAPRPPKKRAMLSMEPSSLAELLLFGAWL